MKIDEMAQQNLLYDFYGELLTSRQRQITELYVEENLSLAEISQELGISRQAVHDALRAGQRALAGYEKKLGLVERYLNMKEAIDVIDERILHMIGTLEENAEDGAKGKNRELIREMRELQSIIDRLEE